MDITIPLVSVSVSGEEKSSTVTMERYDAGTGAGTGKDDRVGHRFTCTFPASASGDKDRDQGQDEKFEWHRTSPAGWTLTTAYANANANEEIATISQNQGLSLTKEFTSSFLGRDVNRGQEWETLVLVSGLQLWYMDFLATMGGG